ncbi:syntaxin-12 [Macrosteles quadrilineatus]|uniref:syntaxin-12 n=1 Tax=Macrosteles quadrilineatus TaxID=74068 RepID=UPI0023E32D28|nr:syntaxin-12 [Macrosteles quadrilineatus]XP_054275420.1 syntaxin-12 [Macrosteles quadrilineatus]
MMEGSFGGYSSNSYQFNGVGSDRSNDFRKIAQKIGTNIQKISSNVSSMKRMVNLLGTPQDSQQMKNELHEVQHYTQNLVKDTNLNLKDLNNIPLPAHSINEREFKMQKDRLHEEFAAAANAFQDIQRFELQKEKEEVRRVRANSNIAPPPSSKDIFGDDAFSNQLIELQDSRQSQTQAQQNLQDDLDLEMLQQQEQSIQVLEKNICEVNDIFKELAVMVHDQGEMVDNIEASLENTTVHVSKATSELQQAAQYTNKLRKKRCILLLCGSAILVILLLLIYYSN